MTLDNDHNPVAPRFPSDPPPRRQGLDAGAQTGAEGVAAPAAPQTTAHPSQSTGAVADPTTETARRRATVRALLGLLPAAALPLAVFALRLWCRALAGAFDAVTAERPPSSSRASTGGASTLPRKLGAALVQAAADALYEGGDDGAASVFDLLSVVWFGALPAAVDAALCRGLPAAALADLDAFDLDAPPPPSTPAPAVPDPAEHNGRFDGPRAPSTGPTSAELSALVHDAAAYLECRPVTGPIDNIITRRNAIPQPPWYGTAREAFRAGCDVLGAPWAQVYIAPTPIGAENRGAAPPIGAIALRSSWDVDDAPPTRAALLSLTGKVIFEGTLAEVTARVSGVAPFVVSGRPAWFLAFSVWWV